MTFSPAQWERLRALLCQLQGHVRDCLVAARRRKSRDFARIDAVTAADTIYGVDRLAEAAIEDWFEHQWPAAWPVALVMEGIEPASPVTFPRGTPVARTVCSCIVDPIDGTRNFMYDKRSAWILAAVAGRGAGTARLGDLGVAAMTELPPSKQDRADQISGVRGGGRAGLVARTIDVRTHRSTTRALQPSRARHFRHGFASLVKFFPEGKALTAGLEEALWADLHGTATTALVFDDQYLSTGGQLYELLVGHDRMIADLRPLVFAKLGLQASLACHPYDICTAFLLAEAGGVVEDPLGRPLAAPLDTTTPVAWVGYANRTLARQVRPVLRRLIRQHLG